MKKKLTFLALLSCFTFASVAQTTEFKSVGENVICFTSAEKLTKCKKLTQKELVTSKAVTWRNSPYYIYKSKDKNSVSYSDSAPLHTSYQKIDLNSNKMKERISFYKSDPMLLEQDKKEKFDAKIAQDKQNELNSIINGLSNVKVYLHNYSIETDDE